MKQRPFILFLVPYPSDTVASQRFRFEQYFVFLRQAGYSCSVFPFLNPAQSKILYGENFFLAKVAVLILGLLRRCIHLVHAARASFVFIHREAAPAGPPVFEWIIARVFRKKIIYDFDDAIWLTDKTNESILARFIRWRSKVGAVCQWSYRISCGNEYLAGYAQSFNRNVIVNPTTIDTDCLHNPALYPKKNHDGNKITIGWTGSRSTLKYLQQLEPVFHQLVNRHSNLRILVIADQKPELKSSTPEFLPWNKKTEAADLLRIDIGVMPLPDDAWSRGKCGFKALQYLSMEIPCIASPVGVNKKIIAHGICGYLAESEAQWVEFLELLISNKDLRQSMGRAGRQRVIENYSVASNKLNFLSLFE